jgi:Raf kinase inhibitor-like YbhB/YbcL family protein
MTIQITSSAFEEGGLIPQKYTCNGEDISPPLNWSGIPDKTESLVLICDDPDAPVGIWVHWVLINLPTIIDGLPEGGARVGINGLNDFHRLGYGGPCPPIGAPHRYFFKLYALDIKLELDQGVSKRDVEKAIKGHVLAQGQLMGKFQR